MTTSNIVFDENDANELDIVEPVVYDGDGLDEDCADEVSKADVQQDLQERTFKGRN